MHTNRTIIENIVKEYKREHGSHPEIDQIKVIFQGKLFAKKLEPELETTEGLPIGKTPISMHLLSMAKDKEGIDGYENISKYKTCSKWVRKFVGQSQFEDKVESVDTKWLTEFARFILYGDHGVDSKGNPKVYLNSAAKNHLAKIRATAKELELPINVPMGKIMRKFAKGEGDVSEMAFCTIEEIMSIY